MQGTLKIRALLSRTLWRRTHARFDTASLIKAWILKVLLYWAFCEGDSCLVGVVGFGSVVGFVIVGVESGRFRISCDTCVVIFLWFKMFSLEILCLCEWFDVWCLWRVFGWWIFLLCIFFNLVLYCFYLNPYFAFYFQQKFFSGLFLVIIRDTIQKIIQRRLIFNLYFLKLCIFD